jgi:hypothetical protein
MKKTPKEKTLDVCIYIMFFILICLVLKQFQYASSEFDTKCNTAFGEGNWEMVENTGYIKGYIGQSWTCEYCNDSVCIRLTDLDVIE